MLREDLANVIASMDDKDGRNMQHKSAMKYLQNYSDGLRPDETVCFIRPAQNRIGGHLIITTRRVIFFGNGVTVLRLSDIDSVEAPPMQERVFPHRMSTLTITARGVTHWFEFFHNKLASQAAALVSRNMLLLD
ncbi:MAG: hypothetical protein JWL97_3752 [Gemmatimonadales bacterium]|jgi:hypothetical protein|nr:hypothetical protein [Gemmatimonadales bacterium]